MKYLYYVLGVLIVLICICQDDIFILFQSMPQNQKQLAENTVISVDSVDAAEVVVLTEEVSACDQGLPEAVNIAEKAAKKMAEETEVVINKKSVEPACSQPDSRLFDRTEAVRLNGKTYQGLEDELIACIAYVENYFPTSYFCGAKWTIGYGTTGYTNGRKVSPGQSISKETAQDCVRHHLRSYVFPVIDQYVDRELSENEMLATCLFIYNIGGGNFANKRGNGRPSAFLKALNDNESSEECARKMTEFYRSAGKKVDGLLKRRWVEGAIFCGYLTAEDILQLEPAGFYNSRNLTDYYMSSRPDRDGFYSYKFDQDTVDRFLDQNRGSNRRVIDII